MMSMGTQGMAPPQQQETAGSNFIGGLSSASMVHQAQTVNRGSDQMGFLNSMSAFGPLMSGGNTATPQQQKDFRALEQTLV